MTGARNPSAIFALFLFPLLFFSGCALHTDSSLSPPEGMPEAYSMEGVGEWDAGGQWWRLLGDPCLDHLVEQALSRNLDIEVTAARLEQAKALYRQARATLFPALDLTYNRSRQSRPGFFGTDTGDSYSLSAAASYELDLWGKLASEREAVRWEVTQARQALFTVYTTMVSEVAETYFTYLEAGRKLELLDQAVSIREATAASMEDRYRNGLVEVTDLLRARQSLEDARAQMPALAAQKRTAANALAVLMGRYAGRDQVCGDQAPSAQFRFPTPVSSPDPGLTTALLENRPDVKEAMARVRSYDARVAQAIADRFPAIALSAEKGRSSTAFSTGAIVGEFWTIALRAVLPIVDGGRRRAVQAAQEAGLREALALYRQSVLRAFKEVEDALEENFRGEQEVARLESLVASARASRDALASRYNSGLADYTALLDAEDAYLSACLRLVGARRRALSHRISLYRALGGNWMERIFEAREEGFKEGTDE